MAANCLTMVREVIRFLPAMAGIHPVILAAGVMENCGGMQRLSCFWDKSILSAINGANSNTLAQCSLVSFSLPANENCTSRSRK